MSNATTKKATLFVNEVLARLKGDDSEALANKISRKAISALQGQVAALDAKQVDDENALEDAQEALNNTIYTTTLFSDNKAYCESIVRAQTTVDNKQDGLDATKASITYFKGVLAKIVSSGRLKKCADVISP